MNVTWDSSEKIWSGSPHTSMYNKDTSLGKIVFNTMRNYPMNVIQVSTIYEIEYTRNTEKLN